MTMEVETGNLKDFQTPSTMDPGLLRRFKEVRWNYDVGRERSGTLGKAEFENKRSNQDSRNRSSSFSHLRSPKYQRKNILLKQHSGEQQSLVSGGVHPQTPINQSTSTTNSLCGDSPANLSQFYEVLLVGKIKVSHKKAPPSFIDEAVAKLEEVKAASESPRSSTSPTSQLNRSHHSSGSSEGGDKSEVDPMAKNGKLSTAESHSPATRVSDKDPQPSTKQLSTANPTESCLKDPLAGVSVHISKESHRLRSSKSRSPNDPEEKSSHEVHSVPSADTKACGQAKEKSLYNIVNEVRAQQAGPHQEAGPHQGGQRGLPGSGKHRHASTTSINNTMLLQIARNELRLISPDKKQVLVQKSFREISHCSYGQQYKEHFGFICKETKGGVHGYVGYVFQCSTSDVVDDVMQGLRTAFLTAHEAARLERMNQQCRHCPMVWFDDLCTKLEGLSPRTAQSVLLKKVESLPDGEGANILAKLDGAETSDLDEQNQIIMMLIKANCEIRQETHVHNPTVLLLSTEIKKGSASHQQQAASPLAAYTPLAPAPGEANLLSEAAKKAKKSLANSFNGIMRRRTSCDVSSDGAFVSTSNFGHTPAGGVGKSTATSLNPAPANTVRFASNELGLPPRSPLNHLTPDKHISFQCEVASPGGRERARTVGSAGGETMKRELARKRLARLNAETLKEEPGESSPSCSGLDRSPMSIYNKTASRSPGGHMYGNSPGFERSTSRQHIYKKVVTPVKKQSVSRTSVRKDRNFRELWQTAIKQVILLNRMEMENERMKEHEELLTMKRKKLDYEDLVEDTSEAQHQWDALLQPNVRPRRSEIRDLVGKGVWKAKRGEIWQLIVAVKGESTPPPRDMSLTDLDESYSTLKSKLTPHHHAILIDLGRTFPNHEYFSGALGVGQLAMFNLLKAYSILDTEVGYCQGLPFLVGLLLMHLEEEEAFVLLKYLMFDLSLRNQFKPDMTGLQVSMYQLTRLLAETQPCLYKLLDRMEVHSSLYSTPWFLTLFAAHFPLGFVARVLDLIFLEGPTAIIKVGVCLLVRCSASLMEADSLEDVMKVVRTDLPNLDRSELEDVLKEAASLNVSRQLKTYEVEYSLLHEDQALKECPEEDPEVIELTRQVEQLQRERSGMTSKINELERTLSSITNEKAPEKEKSESREEELLEDNLKLIQVILNNRENFNLTADIQSLISKYTDGTSKIV